MSTELEKQLEGEEQEKPEETPAEEVKEVKDEPTPKEEAPEEPSDAEREKAGILRDLQEERRRRQELEARVAAKEEVERQAQQTQGPDEAADPLAKLQDDDYLTVGQARSLLERRDSQAQRKQQQDQEAAFKQRVRASERVAQRELTAAEVGEGLDYQIVITQGSVNLTQGDWFDINRSENPAGLTYERCIERTPALAERRLQHRLKKGGPEKPAGGGPPKPPTKPEEPTQEEILGTPPAHLTELLEEE